MRSIQRVDGPELFDALGVLRTEELLAAHQFDGAEQYFTRAVDFGYSFSPEETCEKWGRQEILGDFVRHIRTLRPDVMVTLGIDGTGGGQHHQASAVIAAEAYKAAADPAQFPEQIKAGLRPWQARKLYRVAGGPGGRGRGGPGGPADGVAVGEAGRARAGRSGDLPQRWRRLLPARDRRIRTRSTPRSTPTSTSRCSAARSAKWAASRSGMHMCQGRAPLVPPPAALGARAIAWSRPCWPSQRDKDETSLFEGIDTSLMGLTAVCRRAAVGRAGARAGGRVGARRRRDPGARHRRSAGGGAAAGLRPVGDPGAALEPRRRRSSPRTAATKSISGSRRRKSSFRTRWCWRSRCASTRPPTTA